MYFKQNSKPNLFCKKPSVLTPNTWKEVSNQIQFYTCIPIIPSSVLVRNTDSPDMFSWFSSSISLQIPGYYFEISNDHLLQNVWLHIIHDHLNILYGITCTASTYSRHCSWEENIRSDSPCILWNPKGHLNIRDKPPLVPILSKVNSILSPCPLFYDAY
jgi:hypothetical protein